MRSSAATKNGQLTAPTPHERLIRFNAAARFSGFSSEIRRFVVGIVSPSPIPKQTVANMPSVQLAARSVAEPSAMSPRPLINEMRWPGGT